MLWVIGCRKSILPFLSWAKQERKTSGKRTENCFLCHTLPCTSQRKWSWKSNFRAPLFGSPKKDALSIQMQKINSALPPLSKQQRKTSRNRAENLFLRYPFLARVNGGGPGNRNSERSLAYPPLRRRPRSNAGIMRSNVMQVSGVLE